MEFIQDFMGEKRRREVVAHTLQLTAWKFLIDIFPFLFSRFPFLTRLLAKGPLPAGPSLTVPLFHYQYLSSLEDGGRYKHQQKFLLHK